MQKEEVADLHVEGRLCSMLTVMLGRDLNVPTRGLGLGLGFGLC